MSVGFDAVGFVDLQVNGYRGIDFASPDLTTKAAAGACRDYLRESGCWAMLPTVVTSTDSVYAHVLPILASVLEMPEFVGRLIGLHCEGPFISKEPGAHGAHKVECIIPPSVEFFAKMQQLARGHIKIMTIAAELPGAADFTRHCVKEGVLISLGHQLDDGPGIEACAEAGARMLTHLGNGMPNMIHRHNNGIWAGLANDQLSAGLITDGFHLPPNILKSMIRAKGLDRVVVVSDIFMLGGCKPGIYNDTSLGEPIKLEENGFLHMPSRQCMAGSSCNMLKCMNHLSSLGLLSPVELAQVSCHNPLQLLGLSCAELQDAHAKAMDKATSSEGEGGVGGQEERSSKRAKVGSDGPVKCVVFDEKTSRFMLPAAL